MKQISMLLLLFIGVCGGLYAQERRVQGTVRDENGDPIVGVTVSILNTETGTQTDISGTFQIFAAENTVLVFSHVGYTGQQLDIGSRTTLEVTLESGGESIEEIVVTGAYGIRTSSRSTAYNAQVVNQEQLNTVRQTNLNNGLAGKVAGVQVRSQSAGALGRQTAVRLRGESGLGAGVGAIYVVDGTILPNSNDINMDDIDNVSILQGPAASALFGPQGAAGAIVMSLKKGRDTPGVGIDVNLGMQFDNVYVLPRFQNLYAGGTNEQWNTYTWEAGHPEAWRALEGQRYKDTYDDVSWGPRIDGSEYIPWYAWYPGHNRAFQTANLTAQPNNVRDFYNTGVTANNSITFRQGNDTYSLRIAYNNQSQSGIVPTTSLNRNNLAVSTSYRVTPRLELGTNINYINGRIHGIIDDSYGNSATGALNQWLHRELDFGIMRELRDLSYNGIYASFNKPNPGQYDPANPDNFYRANYHLNFFTYLDNVNQLVNNDRLFGDIYASFRILDGLTLKGTYRKQQNTLFLERTVSSQLQYSHTQNGTFAEYASENGYVNRENIESLLSYHKQFDDFSVQGHLGTDFFTLTGKLNGGRTDQGLVIPDGYFLANSVLPPIVDNYRSLEQYMAYFGTANVGYKNFLFVNGTYRRDRISTLPRDRNIITSKSFGASFIFSDVFFQDAAWLSLGKIRASWGQMPQALGGPMPPFGYSPFGVYRSGMYYGTQFNRWNGNILMQTPAEYVDPNLTGAVATQQELGLDLEFLNNRFGVSATYWEGRERGFPVSVTTNPASGYSSNLINIGEIRKQGLEVQLRGTPLRYEDFRWHVAFTYANLIKSDVVSLAAGLERTEQVADVRFPVLPFVYHEVGQRWGQLIGSGILRNDAGVPILDADGYYQRADNIRYGSVLPNHTGGIQNTFSYKGFNLAVNIDYQFGGKFSSITASAGSYTGVLEHTAAINERGFNMRDPVEAGGGKRTVGVNANGDPVEFYVPVRTYYENAFGRRTSDEFIYDLDFIKLREIALGYELPVDKFNLRRYGIQNANFALVGRNLWLIHDKTGGYFDPAEIGGIAGETAQLPGTRAWGFNLRVGF